MHFYELNWPPNPYFWGCQKYIFGGFVDEGCMAAVDWIWSLDVDAFRSNKAHSLFFAYLPTAAQAKNGALLQTQNCLQRWCDVMKKTTEFYQTPAEKNIKQKTIHDDAMWPQYI
jgi:hypothetical protein